MGILINETRGEIEILIYINGDMKLEFNGRSKVYSGLCLKDCIIDFKANYSRF